MIDPSWIPANREWTECLIRDAGNPASNDPFFPQDRGFDFYVGHSWAKGIFESGDGKDEESTSEDVNFSYACMLWGMVVGNKSLECRASLQLAILRRSLQSYCLYTPNNKIQAPQYIGNCVSGIMFMNKCDWTTYFGHCIEYILGIHMLPTTPISSYVRTPEFVNYEWEAKLKNVAPDLRDGWKGILYLDYSIANPKAAWSFFADPNFNYGWLDGGMSRSWALVMSAKGA